MAANRLIDLSSDTSTRPSAGMRKAMSEAEVGDEQIAADPTTNALQERVADLLGKQAALFLPSGTMCNQIALLVHCRRGDEVIAADVAHIFTSEAGGGSSLAGVQTWPLATKRGIFASAEVAAVVRDPGGRHSPRSRLLALEQTVNRGGGAVWPLSAIEDVANTARQHGLSVHMDGARILNAQIASGVTAKRMAAPCDSVWLDLSKGLGCPVGAVLAGSRAFIDEAWAWKHRLGGALRQSGILAAAGIYALDHNVERLAEDHANARRLAEMIGGLAGMRIMNPEVETNIVFLDPSGSGRKPKEIVAALAKRGVRMGTSYGGMIRAVTHLDVESDDIVAAVAALSRVLKEAGD
ncbi:MAG TPA: GntG family PLP-dependent aldolase [Hyphomicrobiaceae bacterium]|nr:GntG family PLP-dependent aldolase [Hyphomicrobiaceae bacterium]